MRINAKALGFAAATVTAIAFGICGVFFAVMPGPTSAFVSWVLHIDVTRMTQPISALNLVGGIILFGAYVGLFVGITAAIYNKFSSPRQA